MDLISHNPADKVDPPRAERFEGASYTEEELALLIEKTWDHKFGLLIYINAFQPVGENKPFSPTSRFSANRRPISTRTRTEKALDFWWLSQKLRTFSCVNCGGGCGIRNRVPVGKRFSRHNNQSEIDGFCAMIKDDKRS